MMLRDLGGERTANLELKTASKAKKSYSKKEACCEEASEGILDGKLADAHPRHHGTGLLEGGEGGWINPSQRDAIYILDCYINRTT